MLGVNKQSPATPTSSRQSKSTVCTPRASSQLTIDQTIMETENRRVSSHGRGLPGGRPRVAHYFPDTEGMGEYEESRIKLGRLRDLATELGYTSLFDVALAEARHSPTEKQQFVEEGGLEEFYCIFRSHRRRKDVKANEQINEQNRKIDENICDMSRRIYMREWKQLLGDNKLKNAVMNGDSADDFSQAYFSELYAQMDSLAPQLFGLINCLVPDISKRNEKNAIDDATENDKENDKENADLEIIDLTIEEDATPQSKIEKRQRKENRIVVAMSMLTYASNVRNNVFQRWISRLLHPYQIPKKMLMLLHELGICMSYSRHLAARPKIDIATFQETQQTSPSTTTANLKANQQNAQFSNLPESMIPKPQLGTSGMATITIPEKMVPVTETPMSPKSIHQYHRRLMAEMLVVENARMAAKRNSQLSSSQTQPASSIPTPHTTTSQSQLGTSGMATTRIPEKMLPVSPTPRSPQSIYSRLMADKSSARIAAQANSQLSLSRSPPSISTPDTTTSRAFFTTSADPLHTDGQGHPPKRIRVSDPTAAFKVPSKPLTSNRMEFPFKFRPTQVDPRFVAKEFDLSTLQKSELNTFPYGQRRQS